jgi:hypothetical protein
LSHNATFQVCLLFRESEGKIRTVNHNIYMNFTGLNISPSLLGITPQNTGKPGCLIASCSVFFQVYNKIFEFLVCGKGMTLIEIDPRFIVIATN